MEDIYNLTNSKVTSSNMINTEKFLVIFARSDYYITNIKHLSFPSTRDKQYTTNTVKKRKRNFDLNKPFKSFNYKQRSNSYAFGERKN